MLDVHKKGAGIIEAVYTKMSSSYLPRCKMTIKLICVRRKKGHNIVYTAVHFTFTYMLRAASEMSMNDD